MSLFPKLRLSCRQALSQNLTLFLHSAAENTTSGYEVADKAPEPAATESAPVTESTPPAAAPSTEAAPTPAATEKPAAATPAPAAAAQPKQQQKKKGGLFSCCGKPENYDS